MLAGAVHAMAMEPLPAVALTPVGAPGTVVEEDDAVSDTVTEQGLALGTLGDCPETLVAPLEYPFAYCCTLNDDITPATLVLPSVR